jgi:hypothetical protein
LQKSAASKRGDRQKSYRQHPKGVREHFKLPFFDNPRSR